LNYSHSILVPLYDVQGSVFGIHPYPLVTHPCMNSLHSVSD